MMTGAIILLTVSLFILFCVRHFFTQLLSVKLIIDTLVFILTVLRGSAQEATEQFATVAWFILSLGTILFFVLFAAGIRRYSKAKDLAAEAPYD